MPLEWFGNLPLATSLKQQYMYGYVLNTEDTPNENIWTESREIRLINGATIYGCEGDLQPKEGLVIVGYASDWIDFINKNILSENKTNI